MCSARLCLAFFIVITLGYTTATAKQHILKRSGACHSIWKSTVAKALPAVTSALLLFSPLPLEAFSNNSPAATPLLSTEQTIQEDMHARVVFFTQDSVGKRGIVVESDNYEARIVISEGDDSYQHYGQVTRPRAHVALLDWDYSVIGNFVMFTPDGDAQELASGQKPVPRARPFDLPLRSFALPTGVDILDDSRLVYDGMKERKVALGVISATTEDGDYIIKPYHFTSFALDPHDGQGERFAHREAMALPLFVKHTQHKNTDLYLVPQENIFTGLQKVVLEETEINHPFFSALAKYDRQREANAAAQRDNLPLPHENVPEPVVSPYQTGAYRAADFLGKFIYHYDTSGKYLAYVVGQQGDKVVEVLRPGGKNDRKPVLVEQIRASSSADVEGWLGSGVSFVTGSAYPLNHTVHWQGRRMPGARGGVWGAEVVHGSIVSVLDNGLLVVKTQLDTGNGLYLNYHLYLIHSKSKGLLHYGNHHHHAEDN